MPVHHRVPIIISQGISKYGKPYANRILNAEGAGLNYAWKGFKHKSSIVGGIRTGLLGGAIAGNFINSDDQGNNYGIPFKQKAYKFGQKGYRFKRGSSRKYRCKCSTRRRYKRRSMDRRSRFRRSYRM